MEETEKPRRYLTVKNVNQDAKILGLNYISFFVFVFISILASMLFFSQGFLGIIIGLVFLTTLYFSLFFIQVKLGPKKLNKLKNDFLSPIHLIKIKTSFRKLHDPK